MLILLLTAVCSTFQFRAFSQAKATLDEDELLMGNIAKMSILVPLPSDTATVRMPLIEDAKSQKREYFTLLDDTIEIGVNPKQAYVKQGNENFLRYDLSVQIFDSGKYVIPALDFEVGGKRIKSNPVALSVIPVKAKADDKIDPFTDVEEPFEVLPVEEQDVKESNQSLKFLWWLIPCAVILLALIIFLIIRYRNNGTIFFFKPESPAVIAQQQLLKLQKQNLPERGKYKEYYTRLADILRDYISEEFKIKTFEKTTSEIINEVNADSRLSQYGDILNSILETADFVKFAKVKPSRTENNRCLQEAVRFVEITRPSKNEKEKGGDL